MKKTKEKTGKEQKGVERKQKIEQGGTKRMNLLCWVVFQTFIICPC